ncbi:MAG: DnaJ domain-containing protein, partial [Bacteroidota bacterium]
MNYKDYYQVLGVAPRATTHEIRTAYKKLAVKYHPDSNQGDKKAEAKFKEISEAKEILLDEENRQKYDALRSRYLAAQQMRRQAARSKGGPVSPVEEPEMGNVFTSFFEEVFGGSRRKARRGRNYEANVKITLEEAYHGTRDVLSFE